MPFQKGQSGNPGGRPKKSWTWAGLLEQVANETEPKTGKKFKELVSKRLWIDAVNGNLGAAKEIINRMEGMPHQSTDITSGGEPISFNVDEVIGLSDTPTKTATSKPDDVQK